jgi:hypothetical protein
MSKQKIDICLGQVEPKVQTSRCDSYLGSTNLVIQTFTQVEVDDHINLMVALNFSQQHDRSVQSKPPG